MEQLRIGDMEISEVAENHRSYKWGMRYCIDIKGRRQYFTTQTLTDLNELINKILTKEVE